MVSKKKIFKKIKFIAHVYMIVNTFYEGFWWIIGDYNCIPGAARVTSECSPEVVTIC